MEKLKDRYQDLGAGFRKKISTNTLEGFVHK